MNPVRGWPFLADPHHATLGALWAFFAHGALAVAILWPLIARSGHRWSLVALAFLGGSAIDVDHAIAAGSISPHAMEELGYRPDSHSLLLAPALALVVLAITRRAVPAWWTFVLIGSHVLFDAAGGGDRWLWPLSSSGSLPWLAWLGGSLAMLAASGRLAGRGLVTARRGSSRPAASPAAASTSSAAPASSRRPRDR